MSVWIHVCNFLRLQKVIRWLTHRSRQRGQYLNNTINVYLEGLMQCFRNYFKKQKLVISRTASFSWSQSSFLRGRRLSKPNCWSLWTTSVSRWSFTHNKPQRAAWMVCMCVSTLGDMWLVYILYRSNLSAHCVWGISGMRTLPTLYL